MKRLSAPRKKKTIQKKTEFFKIQFVKVYLLLIVVTSITYFGTFQNEFSSYDDPTMIVNNIDIRDLSPNSVGNFFTRSYLLHYHPLTTLSFAIDYAIYGLKAWGFHLTNLILHIINVLLLFHLIFRFSRSTLISGICSLIFSVHPMNVEAVAWATARKDILFSSFYFFALIFYDKYNGNKINIKSFYLTGLFFLLSLLSKSSAVTLPLVLLVMDFYKQRSDKKNSFLEKIPLLILSFAAGILSIITQQETIGTAVALGYSIVDRIILLFYSIGFYFTKFFVPFELSVIHLFPQKAGLFFDKEIYFLASIGFCLLIILLILIKKRNVIFYSILTFVILLLPVLQLIPFAQSVVAERFAYLPYALVFLFIPLAVVNQGAFANPTTKAMIKIVSVVIIFALSVLSIQRVSVWKNGSSLYEDALQKNPNSSMVLTMCGIAKLESADYSRALNFFSRAVENDPKDPLALFSKGTALYYLSNYHEAITLFNQVLSMNQQYEDARYNRMLAYINLAYFDSALADVNWLISSNPSENKYYELRNLILKSINDSVSVQKR